ncbi:MAG TPA: glycosyltransferase family 4 protein, partial [Rhodocyclaceae bacterium]|nr:glycosyltransferase family 4 protein [Rhodocyclaceae bacterium]
FLALRRFIRETHPDAIVSFLTNVNVAAILASLGLRRRVIVSERIHPPQFPVGRLWEVLRRLTYPWAFRVVMLTRESLAWLESRIPGAVGVMIPNPVQYPLPKGASLLLPERIVSTERKLLLAVGRMDKQKGLDWLLASFAALAPQYPDWDLVVLGEGAERNTLEQQVVELGLQGRIVLPGQAGNVGDWYARADLYVMASRFEGFPNTLVEAMAHGCAVVSYDCDTGPRDIIRHEQDGLLVSPVGSIPALTSALARLMGDEVERKCMATRAVEVRERYSMERILAMWDEVLLFARAK